jgi:hypothetical protein
VYSYKPPAGLIVGVQLLVLLHWLFDADGGK